jgi:hypothetical protein
MADFCIYWRNFAKDCDAYGFGRSKPLFDWRTSSTSLYDAVRSGDWLWFFACGEACGAPERTAGYLVELFSVREREPNRGDDTPYNPEDFRYTIWADKALCFWVEPPLLVDAIIRPGGQPTSRHIGNLLQGPRRLKEEMVVRLEKVLRHERSTLFSRLSQVRNGARG